MTELDKSTWLQAQLQQLPEELTPERDLWPGIAARLDRRRHGWVPLAVAASILISAASALFSWHVYEIHRQETAIALQELQRIESPYRAAQAVYKKQWPALRSHLDPATAAAIERNLRIIHQADLELVEQLRRHPGNPALQDLLRQTLAQELDLYQRASRAAYQSI
jgi:hypothetical protein